MDQEYLTEALGIIAEQQGKGADIDVRIGGTTEEEHGSLFLLNCPLA